MKEPGKENIYCYITSVWQEYLNLEDIKPTDNFFVLGGNSVSAIQMLLVLSDKFEYQIDFQLFFNKPYISTLCDLLIDNNTD